MASGVNALSGGLDEKLAIAASNESNTSRRRSAPSASGLSFANPVAVGGGRIGSNSQRPANVPGRASSAMTKAAPPIECPKAWIGPSGSSASSTVRTSAPKAFQSPTCSGVAGESPWPRRSGATQRKWAPSPASTIGV